MHTIKEGAKFVEGVLLKAATQSLLCSWRAALTRARLFLATLARCPLALVASEFGLRICALRCGP